MASTPTTKSQVQAYRFVLKRMESALVRKDAVMLHDPMGSHKRATVVGVVLACVGLIGFLVWGLFGGKGSVPEAGSAVVDDNGGVFVVTQDKDAKKRLIPMFNIASAKLLVMAQNDGAQGGPVETTTVKESALADIPRGPRTGIVNAPVYLPDPQNIAEPSWAICDVGKVRDTLNESQVESSTDIETTVIGGDGKHGTPLDANRSLYVKDQSSGKHYLVYRVVDGLPGQQHTTAVKAEVDQNENAVLEMFGLNGATPRTISTNMLNAIPEVPKLAVPNMDENSVDYMDGYNTGDVVRRTVPGKPDEYFVLRSSGKQEITEGAAAVLHAARTGSSDIPNETGQLTDADNADESDYLPVEHFPTKVPKPVSFQEMDTSCLSWKEVNGEHRITVTVNKGSPASKAPVKLAQYDGNGGNVDYFYMPPGKAAVVHKVSNEAGSGNGPIALISDQGVQYGVKDTDTAKGLGVINTGRDIRDAPPGIVQSLPLGAFLDPAMASFTYDSVPVPPGGVNRPPQKSQAAG